MAGEQRGSGLSARSAAGPAGLARRTPVELPASAGARASRPAGAPAATPPRPAAPPTRAPGAVRLSGLVERRPAAAAPARPPSQIAVPDSRVVYVSVVEAARRTAASPSAIRGWARDGQVRSRTGVGPRGERVEVAVADVERLTAERPPVPQRRPARRRADVAVRVHRDTDEDDDDLSDAEQRRDGAGRDDDRPDDDGPDDDGLDDDAQPGGRRARGGRPRAGQLVPLATVEAMERLSGELYLAGQRAARAEAVAELRDRRLADLQQEVDDLQREATGLWEQNQELLRRVAVAEAQVLALQGRASDAAAESPRWRLRR